MEWTIVDEIRLFRWAAQYKPGGINKHFHMICILERLNDPERYPVTLLQKETVAKRDFTADDVWKKLAEYYDLEALDRIELESPRQSGKDEFHLNWEEYGELMVSNASRVDPERSKSPVVITQEVEAQEIVAQPSTIKSGDIPATTDERSPQRDDDVAPGDKPENGVDASRPMNEMTIDSAAHVQENVEAPDSRQDDEPEGGKMMQEGEPETVVDAHTEEPEAANGLDVEAQEREADDKKPRKRGRKRETGKGEPLAKRTRHSATADEAKKAKKPAPPPQLPPSTQPTRISSRLRRKK